jgi:hypothetical protein
LYLPMIFAAMVLQWSLLVCPGDGFGVVRSFRFERAVLPLTLTKPEPALAWSAFDTFDPAACAGMTTTRGCAKLACERPDPDRFSAFRVSACNYAPVSCSAPAMTARLSCVPGSGMSGCPCAKLAAPAGCVP